MQEYERIDISEGTDVNEIDASKEWDICHYWHFKDIGFKYEKYLCNGCHELMQKAISFSNVAIIYVKRLLTKFIFGIWAKMMQLT